MTEPTQLRDLWPDEPTRSQGPQADDGCGGEDAASSRNSSASSTAPLKISLFLLIASTVAIFIAAVVSSNAAANSPLEQVALAAHRASMFALLLSLFAVLAAYR
jgi:hypothetical protein